MPIRYILLLLVTGLIGLYPLCTQARGVDEPNYHKAFAAIDDGQFQMARSIASRGPDTVLNKVLRGYLMAQPGNNYSFEELSSFVDNNPGWPGLSNIIMITEQKIPGEASSHQVINWFTAHPSLTLVGFYRYIEALGAFGKTSVIADLVKARWTERDFSNDELTTFAARFSNILTIDDHHTRLNRLVWNNNASAVRAMYRYVSNDDEALAEARMALANQSNKAQALIERVPSALRKDPGLLFERLKWYRKNDMDDEAISLLKDQPSDVEKPEEWWGERHIIIRRLMEKHNYALAYRLAMEHGLHSGFEFTQAEFLAGWLALRFMQRADLALTHFQTMLNNTTTPVSRARSAYWIGRTYEVMDNKPATQQAYETAASFSMTFYGQLATTRLYAQPIIKALPEPAIPANIRKEFLTRDIVRAAERLERIGQTDRAALFFKAATNNATQRAEFAVLMDLGYQLQHPDWAITAAKAANQKNIVVGAGAFPLLSMRLPAPPDPAFTHALIRQESLFNPEITSPAGARGLMQLMPGTAKNVAKKLGKSFKPAQLFDPAYNVQLGTNYIQQQLDRFDGSYILALAGYNAGPRRVQEWVEQFGDPRTANIDPIDWIEWIPIYETRNYVQRIIENLQVYRARLNGGQAKLQIIRDLKR